MRAAQTRGASTFANMMPSSPDLELSNGAVVSFICHKYAVGDAVLRIHGQVGSVLDTCPLVSKQGNICSGVLTDEHMRQCRTEENGPTHIHDIVVRWLVMLMARIVGGAVFELEHDVVGTKKRPYDVLASPGPMTKRAQDVVVVNCGTMARAAEAAKNANSFLDAAEQRKHKNFDTYAAQALSIRRTEYAAFAINSVGGVGDEANSTLHALARIAVPGADKDPAIVATRAMWLSRIRKSLVAKVANAHHFAVTIKHAAITGELAREKRPRDQAAAEDGVPPALDRHMTLTDLGVFAEVDVNGIEQPNSHGRVGIAETPPGMPPSSLEYEVVGVEEGGETSYDEVGSSYLEGGEDDLQPAVPAGQSFDGVRSVRFSTPIAVVVGEVDARPEGGGRNEDWIAGRRARKEARRLGMSARELAVASYLSEESVC